MKKLTGKLAFITGSARGIGRLVAVALANEGCDVIIHGRTLQNTKTTQELLKETGVKVYAVAGELSEPAEVSRIINEVKAIGEIDILYNNAGVMAKYESIFDLTTSELARIMQINFYSTADFCAAFAPSMKNRGWGRIVNVPTGMENQPSLCAYSVSKAAVVKYTKELAFELRDSGVLVNLMDPGWLKTDLGGQYAPNEPESVLPGALVPVLTDDPNDNGKLFSAQEYRVS